MLMLCGDPHTRLHSHPLCSDDWDRTVVACARHMEAMRLRRAARSSALVGDRVVHMDRSVECASTDGVFGDVLALEEVLLLTLLRLWHGLPRWTSSHRPSLSLWASAS
eukprot:m.4122 g.4122  ORF g.4122 m.4122 type:complete len:108 (+) comp1134_c0_seq1:279-602(+)